MLIKRDPDTLKTYMEDSSNLKGGSAEEVAVPEDIEELASYLSAANSKRMPVTISGGGTGTTGSRIPFGGAVISLERFNHIYSVSEKEMSASLQTGVLVEDLKKGCDQKGLFYTSHPTESTATVGGTVATNASGARSFKYGATRKYVKRLKMVLASGAIIDIKRGERFLTRKDSKVRVTGCPDITVPLPTYRIPDVKNASGYYAREGMDLIDLFIGQEGTLSVIAEMEIALVKKPAGIFSSFVFFRKESDAWDFAREARDLSKKNRSAGLTDEIDALSIEYFDHNAIKMLAEKNANVPEGASSAIFIEQETMPGNRQDALVERWMKIIESHNASLDDTWVAMTEKEAAGFAQMRYAIPEAVNDMIRRKGLQKLSTDISVPDSAFPEMMAFYVDTLKASPIDHVIFGHIGESHVHVNLLPGSEIESKRAADVILKFVRKGVSLGGSVSAEHGIGKIKHKYLEEMYGKSGILDMARIKKAFDPNCILGLDNIFPKDLLKLV